MSIPRSRPHALRHHLLRAALAASSLLLVIPAPAGADQEGGKKSVAIPRSILDVPGRTEDDRKQDAGRKALDVYEFLGIAPGMTVADLFCSGGYNTHLLSHVVGEAGKVYAVFEFYAEKELFDGRLYKVPEVEERIRNGKLGNVVLTTKISEIPAGSIDAMIAVRNYHDVEWVFQGLKRDDVVKAIHAALKPGGVVAIEDVATHHDGWHKETHRLNEKVVIEDFEKGGFVLVERSNLLANPADDHSRSGFEEGRYGLDRYLLKFVKPGGSK